MLLADIINFNISVMSNQHVSNARRSYFNIKWLVLNNLILNYSSFLKT